MNRVVLPGGTFWNGWTSYPFSATDWGGRPLGVQALSLAYRSGAPWNETGFGDPEFDAKLDEAIGIFDPDKRRVVMADIEAILRRQRRHHPAVLAQHVPASHAGGDGLRAPSEPRDAFERVWLDQTV